MSALMTGTAQSRNVQPVDPCVTKMVMVLPCVLAAIRTWERFNRSKPLMLHGMTYRVRRTLLSLKRRRGKNTLSANDNSPTREALCGESISPTAIKVKVFLHLPQLAFRAVLQSRITTTYVLFYRKPHTLCGYFDNANFRSHRSIVSYGI